MRFIRNSLFYRLSAAFFAVTVTTAVLYGWIFSTIWNQFRNSAEQWLYWEVAEALAHDLRPLASPLFLKDEIDKVLYRYSTYSPQVDVYILNPAGRILSGIPSDRGQVDVTPIQKFLASAGVPSSPIYGPSPRTKTNTSLFSAAPLEIEGRPGYVYIVLSGAYREKLFNVQGDKFAAYSAAGLMVLTLFITLPLGVSIFAMLTRRFSAMTEELQAFEKGDHTRRLPAEWKDEFGLHARAFNNLADSLTATIQRLEQSDSMRRELVANISHDLRTPVAAMQTSLEVLEQGIDHLDSEEHRRLIQAAGISSSRLSGLVEDLFELSSLDAPTIRLNKEIFPLDEMLDDVVAAQRIGAEKAGISVGTDYRGDSFIVWGDSNLLSRALANLLENAIRYSLKDSSVQIRLTAEAAIVRCEITDTGIGMSEAELAQAFDRFYRSDRARELNRSGSGLGLNVVKRIFDLHEIAAGVESSPGRGTTWKIAFPAEPLQV